MADKIIRVDVYLKSGRVLKLRCTKFERNSTGMSWTTKRRFWQKRFHPFYIDMESVEALVQRSR